AGGRDAAFVRRDDQAQGPGGGHAHAVAVSHADPDAHADAHRHPDREPHDMRVAVLAGGRSSEHEVSLDSAAAVREGVLAAGHEVVPITIERSGAWLHEGETLTLEPGGGLLGTDAVWGVLHGPFGEDETLQGLLELPDVP